MNSVQLATPYTHVAQFDEGIVLVGSGQAVAVRAGPAARVLAKVDGLRSIDEIAFAGGDQRQAAFRQFTVETLVRENVLATGSRPANSPSSPNSAVDLSRSAWADVVAGGWHAWVDPKGRRLVVTSNYLTPSLVEELVGPSPSKPTIVIRVARTGWCLGPSFEPAGPSSRSTIRHLGLVLPGDSLLAGGHSNERLHLGVSAGTLEYEYREALSGALQYLDRLDTAQLNNSVAALDNEGALSVHRLPACRRSSVADFGSQVSTRKEVVGSAERRPVGARNGFRNRSLEETLRDLEPLVHPTLGIVRSVRRTEARRESIHSYSARYVIPTRPPTFESIASGAGDRAGGKGGTDEEARTSALAEAVERFAGTFHGDEEEIIGAFRDLGSDALHPSVHLGFSDAQYEGRHGWSLDRDGDFSWIPARLELDEPVSWGWVSSLTSGEQRLVLNAHLYLGFTGAGRANCRADTNGLAAGNDFDEAVLQGLLELVERDAVAIWWYNRTRQAEVDLEPVEDQAIQASMEYHDGHGRSLWVLDLTTDLGIPCCAAVSAPHDPEEPGLLLGFGAHVDPVIALRRAVTEVNQVSPWVLDGIAEQRAFASEHPVAHRWLTSATVATEPYLVPDSGKVADRAQVDQPVSGRGADIGRHVGDVVALLAERGLEVYVHDMSRSNVPLSVVRVVAPGLRHFWPRFGPGRLYSVPVELGRLSRPMAESALNPWPMFL